MSSLCQRLQSINKEIEHASAQVQGLPHTPTLVAVSKTHSAERIEEAYNCGARVFGENYIQELCEKAQRLQHLNIEWHCIGHLQSNKVKYIAPFIHTIHTVDSISLAKEISKQALKHNRVIRVLFQVNTSGEESKSGIDPQNLLALVRECAQLPALEPIGLMCIPKPVENPEDSSHEFTLLRTLRNSCAQELSLPNFVHLSMGMTDDFSVAIREGATYVRIGSAIFGEREYL